MALSIALGLGSMWVPTLSYGFDYEYSRGEQCFGGSHIQINPPTRIG